MIFPKFPQSSKISSILQNFLNPKNFLRQPLYVCLFSHVCLRLISFISYANLMHNSYIYFTYLRYILAYIRQISMFQLILHRQSYIASQKRNFVLVFDTQQYIFRLYIANCEPWLPFFLNFHLFFVLLCDPNLKKSILYPSLLWMIFGNMDKESTFHLSSSKIWNWYS